MLDRPTVFISYSHKDKVWLEQLSPHLTHLSRESRLHIWDDRKISTGDNWESSIEAALGQAKVAVLLISKYFLDSKFIIEIELPKLLSKHKQGMTVLPLILGPCRYEDDKRLGVLQAFNDPTKTVEELTEAEKERLFVNLSRTIDAALSAIEDLQRHEVAKENAPSSGGFGKASDDGLYNDRIRLLLFKKRMEKYQKLWELTILLPKWPRATQVTYSDFKELTASLRDWYFNEHGGLYLTRESHCSYTLVQEELTKILNEEKSGHITDEHYDSIRQKFSTLRTELTEDLQTRRR